MKRYEPLRAFDWMMAEETDKPIESGFTSFVIVEASKVIPSYNWTDGRYITFKTAQGQTFKKWYIVKGCHQESDADARLTQRIFNRWRDLNGRERDTGALVGCMFAAYVNVRTSNGKAYYDFGKYGDPLAKQYVPVQTEFDFKFNG